MITQYKGISFFSDINIPIMQEIALNVSNNIHNGEPRTKINDEVYEIITISRRFIGEAVMDSIDPHSRFSERCHWFGGYPKSRESIEAEWTD